MRRIDLHAYPGTQEWITCQGPYVEPLAAYWKREWKAKAEPDVIELLGKVRKSLDEQMRVVLLCLTKEFRPITALFEGAYTRNDAVYWFLSLLELIRLKKAAVKLEGEEVLFAKK